MNPMVLPENQALSAVPEDDLYGTKRVLEEATQSFVTFRLGAQWYGVPVKDVREIVRTPPIAALPSAPFSILGIANVRGNLLAVIDPKKILGISPSSLTPHSRLVVLAAGGAEAGLLADEVAEMISVPVSHLEPPLATLNSAHLPYVESVCKWKDQLIANFHVEKLLDFKKIREGP